MSIIGLRSNQLRPVRADRLPKAALALGFASLVACGDAGSTFTPDGTGSETQGGSPVEGMGPMSPGAAAPGDMTAPPQSPGSNETLGMNGVPVAPGTPSSPMTGGTPPTDTPTDTPPTDTPPTDMPPTDMPPVTEPCPTGPVCHEFFASDNANNVVNYVNEFDPSKNWRAPVGVTGVNSPRQVELIDDPDVVGGKAVLVSVNTGFQEYHPVTGERLLDVRLAGTADVRGALRLPDGNTVLGIGNDTLRTVDRAGSTVRSCTLPGAGDLRVLNQDSEGNILLGRNLDLFRVNSTCQQQWTARLPAGGKAYSVIPRPGGVGGVWATSGGPTTVVEFDEQGQILRQVGGRAAHPTTTLDFFSGFKLLPNGNMVVANWQGYVDNPTDSTPHLIEFSPENELVWRWGNQTVARQITNVFVLR